MTIYEKREVSTKKIKIRGVKVEFGNVLSQDELNNLLGKRNIDQLTEANYKTGIRFKINTHSDVVNLFSTLHEISRFSDVVKTEIVNYLVPNMKEKDKLILKQEIFSKYVKIHSLFNLCLDKINENPQLIDATDFDFKPKMAF